MEHRRKGGREERESKKAANSQKTFSCVRPQSCLPSDQLSQFHKFITAADGLYFAWPLASMPRCMRVCVFLAPLLRLSFALSFLPFFVSVASAALRRNVITPFLDWTDLEAILSI